MVENLFIDKLTKKWNDHDGYGYIFAHRMLKYNPNFKTDFIDIAVIPPDSSIGRHKHVKNEETYVILRGKGLMYCGDKEVPVREGDIIVNPAFGEHGLVNNSNEDIHLLVFQSSEIKHDEQEKE